MITTTEIDKKMDNIQDQLGVMNREAASFRGYVNHQFESIFETMATKEDLRATETRLTKAITETKKGVAKLDERVEGIEETLVKIAEKIGVAL